ncbi:hypothetical protein AVEN_42191-1 [Araneus ventricosus]|uniref:Uncharacterized protein n=1 Tax=Araneus ventricosus TaxID=182803 RepID=A0A4Y2AXY9_ARAVE|nr:hypothetical protein AVEN_42191-1 [Araneus ventricosus]
MGISQSSVVSNFLANKGNPYKLQILQHLAEDDPDPRTEFCEWPLNMHEKVSGQNWLERLSLCVGIEGRCCGTYPVAVASYDTICKNKIKSRHRFHQLHGDL